MTTIELASAAIVAVYLAVRSARDEKPAQFLARMAALCAAAFLGEDGVIRAYHFYGYDREAFSLFLDQVPLLIVLIWPVVIHSAWDLARRFADTPLRVATLAGGIVFADAWLIEPIAVRAGLWRWTDPGLFAVPPIGVLGWACFAFGAVLLLERGRERLTELAMLLVLPAAFTHAALHVAWWGLLRWISATIPPLAGVIAASVVSSVLLFFALRARARDRVPPIDMWLRAPGAAFFFVLLASSIAESLRSTDVFLVAYALAFAPPYCALVRAEKPSLAPVSAS